MDGITQLDLRGARCPIPVLKLDKAMREGARGVDLLSDDPVARIDVPDLCATRGWVCETPEPGLYIVRLKAGPCGAAAER